MPIKKRRRGPAFLRIVSERRSGIDRRVLNYDCYIPERRTPADRRKGECHLSDNHAEWRGRLRYA